MAGHYFDPDSGRVYLGGMPARLQPPTRPPPPGYQYALVRSGGLADTGLGALPILDAAAAQAAERTPHGGILIRVRPEVPDRMLGLADRMITLSEKAASAARWMLLILSVAITAALALVATWVFRRKARTSG